MPSNADRHYIINLDKYLKQPSTPPDLTVKFGDKVYKIHKLLACAQSEWFSKAVNGAFKEGKSGVITLQDDHQFGPAIGCMVNFFYDAQYSIGTGPADILHAQVCALGDKYMCQALFDYAEESFSQILRGGSYKLTADWVKLGTLVYDHLTTDLPSHVKMRKSVVFPIYSHSLENMTEIKEIRTFLKSYPLAAVDILFEGQREPKRPRTVFLFKCPHCIYAHDGPENCSYLSSHKGFFGGLAGCPKCGGCLEGSVSGTRNARIRLTHRCITCGGMHTG